MEKKLRLFRVFFGDEILPSNVGIKIYHYNDSYETTRIQWKVRLAFFVVWRCLVLLFLSQAVASTHEGSNRRTKEMFALMLCVWVSTLPWNQQFAPENRPFAPKGKYLVFEPFIFRCKLAVSFREGSWWGFFQHPFEKKMRASQIELVGSPTNLKVKNSKNLGWTIYTKFRPCI